MSPFSLDFCIFAKIETFIFVSTLLLVLDLSVRVLSPPTLGNKSVTIKNPQAKNFHVYKGGVDTKECTVQGKSKNNC
jgi:hypothetical protein